MLIFVLVRFNIREKVCVEVEARKACKPTNSTNFGSAVLPLERMEILITSMLIGTRAQDSRRTEGKSIPQEMMPLYKQLASK